MRRIVRSAAAAGTALVIAAWTAPWAAAQPLQTGVTPGASNAVFVQNDNTGDNVIYAYSRASDGTLTLAGTYPTGGLGGQLIGSVVDHLASQGSLVYDPAHYLLYAVNAGSGTVSVFGVFDGDRLHLRQTISSGGTFPSSITVHGNLVYVLNSLGGGSLVGFRVEDRMLVEISDSTRSLGLTIPTSGLQYSHTPGQVTFSPDGSRIYVTTKINHSDIYVYAVGSEDRLSLSPEMNPEGEAYPFAAVFDPYGHMVVADLGTSSLSTFTVNTNRTLAQIDSVATGGSMTCWLTAADGYYYASNPGSSTLSTFQTDSSGDLTLDATTPTDGGTVDSAATSNSDFLYVQTGKQGIVDEFQIGAGGGLTEIGTETVTGAVGGEGIVAF